MCQVRAWLVQQRHKLKDVLCVRRGCIPARRRKELLLLARCVCRRPVPDPRAKRYIGSGLCGLPRWPDQPLYDPPEQGVHELLDGAVPARHCSGGVHKLRSWQGWRRGRPRDVSFALRALRTRFLPKSRWPNRMPPVRCWICLGRHGRFDLHSVRQFRVSKRSGEQHVQTVLC